MSLLVDEVSLRYLRKAARSETFSKQSFMTFPVRWKGGASDKRNWNNVSWGFALSEDNMREFADQLWWNHLCRHQHMSDEFIIEMGERINIEMLKLNENVNLTPELIAELSFRGFGEFVDEIQGGY